VGDATDALGATAPYADADTASPGTCAACASPAPAGASSCAVAGATFANPITAWRSRAYFAKDASFVGGGSIVDCDGCQPRLGSLEPGTRVTFQGVSAAGAGTGRLLVYYTDGDALGATRRLDVAVNGMAAGTITFPGNQDWAAPVSVAVTADGFLAGEGNTVTLSVGAGGAGPDLVWIEVLPGGGD
jgi:hypothetical protein